MYVHCRRWSWVWGVLSTMASYQSVHWTSSHTEWFSHQTYWRCLTVHCCHSVSCVYICSRSCLRPHVAARLQELVFSPSAIYRVEKLDIVVWLHAYGLPSVLWRCSLGGRKGIRPSVNCLTLCMCTACYDVNTSSDYVCVQRAMMWTRPVSMYVYSVLWCEHVQWLCINHQSIMHF